jgi:hypothetical protein
MQEVNLIDNVLCSVQCFLVFVAPEKLAGAAAIEVHAEVEGPMRPRSGSNGLALEYSMRKLCWES